jgi:hypothetical protein
VAESPLLIGFDARLERVLTAYGDAAVRPVDAVRIAETAVLIERRRQVRRPWTLLAAAALLLMATLAAAALMGGSGPNPFDWLGLGPRASSAPTARPTIAPGIPPALQGIWMGSPRAIGDFEPSAGTFLSFDGDRLCISGRSYAQDCSIMLSTISIDASELRLVTRPGGQGCGADLVGRYRWHLSPGEDTLTIGPPPLPAATRNSDACAARAEGVSGTWYRSVCVRLDDSCLGVLEAGRYPSQFLHARGEPGEYSPTDFGAVEYQVPEGWANSGDWPVLLSLTPAEDYSTENSRFGQAEGKYHELDVFAHPEPAAQNAECDGTVETALGSPTPAAFAAWISTQPAFETVDRGALTVGGLPAVALDIRLASGFTGHCSGEADVSADYLLLRDDPGRGFTPRLRGAEVHHLILVDLGGGELLAIVIDSSDPARFDSLAAASMPIVDSLVIR